MSVRGLQFRDQTLDKPEVLPVVSCCRRQVLQAHKDIEKRGDVRSGCEELVRDPFVSTKNALALEVASPSTRRETVSIAREPMARGVAWRRLGWVD